MFTSDGTSIITTVLNGAWSLFGITIPGTSVSFGALALGCIGTIVAIRIFKLVFNIDSLFGVATHMTSSGRSGKAHISNERKDDTK